MAAYYDETQNEYYDYNRPPTFPGSSQKDPDGVVDMYRHRRDAMRGPNSAVMSAEERRAIETTQSRWNAEPGPHNALSRDYNTNSRRAPLQSTTGTVNSPLFGAPIGSGNSTNTNSRAVGGYGFDRRGPLMSQPGVALPTRLRGRP